MKYVWRVAAFVVLCALAWAGKDYVLDALALRPENAWSWPWVVGYLGLCIVANSVFWPVLAAGLWFGGVGGVALAVGGAFLGATVQFVLVRSLLREPVEAWFGARLAPVQRAVEAQGLPLLVVWRILWMPSAAITVATALTRISLAHHLLAMLGMVPGMVAVAWMADMLLEHGLWELPTEGWAGLGAAAAVTLVGWWLSRRHLVVARPA